MSAELQKLKQRQQQLENRNALLEKLHQLSAARPEQGTYVEGVIVVSLANMAGEQHSICLSISYLASPVQHDTVT